MGARGVVERAVASIQTWAWLILVGPFCVASELPRLAVSRRRPVRLTGEVDQYPVTELLGRIITFQSRLRLVRALVLLTRAIILCAIILLGGRIAAVVTHQSFGIFLTLGVFLVAGWGLHLALHHTISPFEVARLIDRNLGLEAQVATAVEFTLADRLDRPLARTQIRQATNRLRDLDPQAAFPAVWPGRDTRILGTIVVAYGVTVAIGAAGVNLPGPVPPIDAEVARQATQVPSAPSQFVQMDASSIPFQTGPAALLGAQPQNSQLAGELNQLQQQLQNQAISPQQYQQGLKQVQQQIAQQAQQSLAAQDALNALASSLNDASTTQSISDSLNQGDYQQASQQLSDLGKQLPQMSTQARQELAQQFDRAAQQTQKLNPDISQSSQQTSQALSQGNNQAASQALQDLAKAVQQAGQQVSGQSQLGQEMQNVQGQLGNSSQNADPTAAQPGSNGNNPSQSSSSGSSDQTSQASAGSSSSSDPSQNSSATSAASGQNGNSPEGQGSGPGASGQSPTNLQRGVTKSSGASSLNGSQSDNGGGVGNTPGGNPLGGAPQPLDTQGVKVTILGQPSGPGSGSTQAGNRSDPLTAPDGSVLNATGGASAPPSNVPVNVHQESNQVPIGMKPVVREYFSNGGN